MKRQLALAAVAALVLTTTTGSSWAGSGFVPTAAQSRAEALYLDLNHAVFGTAADRYKAEELLNLRQQRRISDCMAEHGFDYRPIPYRGGVAREVNPGDSTAFAPVGDDFGWGAGKLAAARPATDVDGAAVFAALSEADQKAWRAAMSFECAERGFAGTDSEYPGDGELGNVFHGLIEELNGAESVQSRLPEYVGCMVDAGFDVTVQADGYEGHEPWANLQGAILDRYPRGIPDDPETLRADPRFVAAVAYEASAAKADVGCRAALHYEVLGAVAGKLAGFKVAHAGELAALAEQWERLRADHAAAGL
ncbi:hypothetical protein AB0I28_23670 [Phytomonospora sp. NPDC050363]|uniref:hypothetical protein n=1 Tax=Phytomonospora sp. NPDC050363 TaxID=3155642 RepID=UPI0033C48416